MHTRNTAEKSGGQDIKNVSVVTLGCSKNTVDSEELMGIIRAHNLELTETDQADALVINTCGFIDLAKQESVNAILEGIELRKAGKIRKLVVAGCLSQRYADDLRKEMPEVDHFFGTTAFEGIVRTLTPNFKYDLLGERVLSEAPHFAYLKISEGCDNPCSFCAIPLMRGKHRSKSPEQVVIEARGLVNRGVKEVILIAQDLTNYGKDLVGERTLADLLKRLSDIEGLEWLRLMYAYPSKFPRDILPVMAERPNIAKYLNMPLQHASTEVLKSMRRGITRRATEELIAEIRESVPGIALRTTMIVGYPTERQEHFEEMLDFVERMKFDRLGVFDYSQEDDTYAYILGDPIPLEEKERRRSAILEVQREISAERNEAMVGKRLRVMIDEKRGESYQGRTEFDAPEVDNEIHVRSSRDLKPGDFVDVEVWDSEDFDLFADDIRG